MAPVVPHRRGSGRRGRSRRSRAERRAELLEAAIRVIRRDGPEASMSALAAEAGVTKPILYRHFGDRAGLYRAIAEQTLTGIVEEVRSAITAEGDPREALRAAIDAFCRFVDADANLYRFLADQRHLSDVGAFVHDVGRAVAVILDERLAATGTGTDLSGTEAWAHGMVGFVLSAADWWARDRSISRNRLVDHLTTFLWNGLSGVIAPATSVTSA